ncbi:MAG: sulfur carrier protein ThiS [Tannerella sp.]|jgi:sulfur carrier protein|nr:sulfur carrier protein ThiS [Tannerella sp.]
MSKVIVNDEAQEVTLPLTLSELIRLNNVLQPDMVSVQINGEFVNREDFDTVAINDGDAVDFLYFMGGGC